jgi:hypothetical protein
MTDNKNTTTFFQSIKEAPQKIINFISGAVARIFSPRDDNYPETGTQPFEGDSAEKKHY